jgi:hypothetical protein
MTEKNKSSVMAVSLGAQWFAGFSDGMTELL